MDDEYKEDDAVNAELTGFSGFLEYLRKNVLRQTIRGALFGIGHFISYKILGNFISKRFSRSVAG